MACAIQRCNDLIVFFLLSGAICSVAGLCRPFGVHSNKNNSQCHKIILLRLVSCCVPWCRQITRAHNAFLFDQKRGKKPHVDSWIMQRYLRIQMFCPFVTYDNDILKKSKHYIFPTKFTAIALNRSPKKTYFLLLDSGGPWSVTFLFSLFIIKIKAQHFLAVEKLHSNSKCKHVFYMISLPHTFVRR